MNKYFLKNTSPSLDGDGVIYEIYDFSYETLVRFKILYGIVDDSQLINENEKEISEKEFLYLKTLDEYTRAIVKGISLLSYSQSTKKGLALKLIKYGFSKQACEYAAIYLSKKGYINETLQAELLIDNLASKKLYGEKRIKKDLFSKGFSEKIINETIANSNIDFDEICAKRINKTCKIEDLDDNKERQKIFSKLLSYGFSIDNIKNGLELLLNEET